MPHNCNGPIAAFPTVTLGREMSIAYLASLSPYGLKLPEFPIWAISVGRSRGYLIEFNMFCDTPNSLGGILRKSLQALYYLVVSCYVKALLQEN